MKKNFKLKLLGILFAIFYFFVLGDCIVKEIPSAIEGFKEGSKAANEQWDKNFNHSASNPEEVCFLKLTPKKGHFSYPTHLINLKSGISISVDLEQIIAKVPYPQKQPLWFGLSFGFAVFIAFLTLLLFIFIPVQAYKTIRSILKDDIFNLKTIVRIRRIGYALLIIFGCLVLTDFVSYKISKQILELEDYNIAFSLSNQYILLNEYPFIYL